MTTDGCACVLQSGYGDWLPHATVVHDVAAAGQLAEPTHWFPLVPPDGTKTLSGAHVLMPTPGGGHGFQKKLLL